MTKSFAWRDLDDELSRWNDEGREAVMWLRDDDAVTVTPALDRLETLARRYQIEAAIATIPAFTDAALVARFRSSGSSAPAFVAMCHGWRHDNHARPEAPAEFGPDRRPLDIEADLKLARAAFERTLGISNPYFVPPFGQIAPPVRSALVQLGFSGLSNQNGRHLARLARLAARTEWLPPCPAPQPVWPSTLDAHVDPVDWSRKTARADEHSIAALIGELRLRRKGYKPVSAPIGLLGHHLVHDEAIWSSLERLVSRLRQATAVRFPPITGLMEAHRFRSAPPMTLTEPALAEH